MHFIVSCAVAVIGLAVLTAPNEGAQTPAAVRKSISVERMKQPVMNPMKIRAQRDKTYVLARRDHAVAVLDADFALILRIGRIGQGPGELYNPEDFDVASDGSVWVADTGNSRLSQFRDDGTYVRSFVAPRPTVVRVLADSSLAVVEADEQSLVSIYSQSGDLLYKIGEVLAAPGASARQSAYLQRSALAELPEGILLAAPRFWIPPMVLTFSRREVKETWALPTDGLEALLTRASERNNDAIKRGIFGGTVVINDIGVRPEKGTVWIAPGAEGVFERSLDGSFNRIEVVDSSGVRYGFQAFTFRSAHEIIGVSGPFVVRGRVVD